MIIEMKIVYDFIIIILAWNEHDIDNNIEDYIHKDT